MEKRDKFRLHVSDKGNRKGNILHLRSLYPGMEKTESANRPFNNREEIRPDQPWGHPWTNDG